MLSDIKLVRWYRIRTPRFLGAIKMCGGICTMATPQFDNLVGMKIMHIQSQCGRNKWSFTRRGKN